MYLKSRYARAASMWTSHLPLDLTRSTKLNLTFLVCAILAAYIISPYIIAGDVPALAHISLAVLGLGLIAGILSNWNRGVYFFLGWLLFEDFVRKFSGNNM